MPKKFGLNTKKEEAKARVAETKKSKAESERKAKEDLEWQDHDKLLKAKEDRKKENLEKKIREKERKEENKKIDEQESEFLAIIRLSEQGAVLIEGSGIDNAVNLLEEEKLVKHPEKKVKQAWNEYVENNFDRLKKENPSLKRSQLLEILHKEFEKSDKNPFNKQVVEYNAKIH